jgi:hypothetical protein
VFIGVLVAVAVAPTNGVRVGVGVALGVEVSLEPSNSSKYRMSASFESAASASFLRWGAAAAKSEAVLTFISSKVSEEL